jgi:hypothetical protein
VQYPRKSLSLAALGLGLVVAACQWIVGIDGDLRVAAPERDAGADASTDGGAPDPCRSEGIPSVPADATPGGDISIVFALRSLDFGIDGGAPVGLNLDGRCTCPGPESCRAPGAVPCDQERGIDNGSRDLLAEVFGRGVLDQPTINSALQSGYFGSLVQIDGWNGEPDDAHVSVQVFASQGFDQKAVPGRSQPVFDGKDVWTVDDESVARGGVDGGPPYVSNALDDSAFVAGGALVSTLSFPIIVGSSGPRVRIKVGDGRLFATIRTEKALGDAGVQYSLQGTLAGRWRASDLLGSLASLSDPITGAPICGDSGVYQLVKSQVCARLDIPAQGSNDDLGQSCSAVSLGAKFVAVNAKLGSQQPKPDSGGGCGPTWSDSCGP